MSNKTEIVVRVDQDLVLQAIEYLAVIKDRVERGDEIPKETVLGIIKGYSENMKSLIPK